MITIQKVSEGTDPKVQVLFTMSAMDGCGDLYLVGWFDEWHESVYRMQREDNGAWYLILELEPGCEYQYCFRTSDGTWLHDPDTPCTLYAHCSKNSFVIGLNGVNC